MTNHRQPKTQNPESTWFGQQQVSPDEKTARVFGVFDNVASRYDLMNDVMSGGLHRLWKDRFVRMIRPRPGLKYLDVAGGTGDIAFRIKKKILSDKPTTDNRPPITILDLTPHMLETGQSRALDHGWINDFNWVTGNAENLPFPDDSFDVYTIAFGMRNVTHIDTALAEAFRVLRPGGRFFCMEFSRVESTVLSRLYDLYSYNIIPAMGEKIAGDRDSYQYLVESIRKFPSQRKFLHRIEDQGFKSARFTNFSAGIVAVHQAVKP